MTDWVNVSERLPESGPVLICFLEPFFGRMTPEIGVGYYDNPEHYEEPSDATGWRFWIPDRLVLGGGVTHWMPLPDAPSGSDLSAHNGGEG